MFVLGSKTAFITDGGLPQLTAEKKKKKKRGSGALMLCSNITGTHVFMKGIESIL